MLSDPKRNEVEVLAITFEAGARSRPHVHPAEEVLHVISGEGVLVMEKDHVAPPCRRHRRRASGGVALAWRKALEHTAAARDRPSRRNGLERAREDLAGSVKSGWSQ